MPSVTALAFNYLTCWQLEVGKQAEKKNGERKRERRKSCEEQKAGLDSDLSGQSGQAQYFLGTSLKSIHLGFTARITCTS